MWTEAQYIAASDEAEDRAFLGDYEAAPFLLKEALAQARAARDTAFMAFLEGRLALMRGQVQESLSALKRADQLRPNCPAILRQVGVALGYLHRREEAIQWFERALAVRPEDPRALSSKGAALGNLGKLDDALECFDRAMAADPGWLYARRERAITLGLLGKRAEAAAELRKYLDEHPRDDRALFMAAVFESPDRTAEFVKEFEERHSQREQERMVAHEKASAGKEKLEAWRTLSARSAHRIGNELFASRGALRTLQKAEDPEAREAVCDLEASLDRMRRAVQEYQTFSTNKPPRLLPVELGPLLRDTVRRYAALADGIEISETHEGDLPLCLLDRSEMEQALGELLENALRHSAPDGSIRVIAGREGGSVRITVEDTGPGVLARDKERIFEPFVALRPGGSGVGLAVVRQIVGNHGGTIRETGTPGAGARFEIELPAQPDEEKPR